MVSVIEPVPWWPRIGVPLIAAMSTALPELWCETLPALGVVAVAALERGDGGPQARRRQELERREHAAVDLAGADVVAAARVEVDVRVGQHPAGERLLRHQQDLADAGVGRRRAFLPAAR